MRVLKALAVAVAVLVLLLLLAAAGLWVWAGTQSSLDWTLNRLAQSQSIRAEQATGSLRGGVKAGHLVWEGSGLKVEAFDAELAWQPLALAHATLEISRLHAARLRIEDQRPPQPKQVPAQLQLPLRVDVRDVRVGQLQWVTPQRSVEVSNVAGAYSFDGGAHHAKVASVTWMQDSFSGDGSLQAGGAMALDARVHGRIVTPVPGSKVEAPLLLDATASGKLTAIDVKAQLKGTPDSPTAGTSMAATARVAPWAAQPLPQVDATFERLDVGALWPQAPRTALSGQFHVTPQGEAAWTIAADATNASPGPWNERKLPLEQLTAQLEWRTAGEAVFHKVHARAGGGTVDASGQWRTSGAWAVDAKLAGVDPGAVSTQFAHLPVGGTAQVKGEGRAIAFDVDLKASGAARDKAVAALELRSAKATGRWDGETVTLATLDVRTSDASLQGEGAVQPHARSGSGRVALDAPGVQLRVDGKLAQHAGGGQLELHASDIAQALKWAERWPGIPPGIGAQIASGRVDAQGTWQGGWSDPAVQARIDAPQLTLQGATPTVVRDATLSVEGRLSDAQLRLHARAEQPQRRLDLDAAARGGRKGAQWQGQLTALNASVNAPDFGTGAWGLALQRPMDWRWSRGAFETGAGEALVRSPHAGDAPAKLAWNPVRFGGGELHTSGHLDGLPLAWIEFFGGPQLSASTVTGNMVFNAQWDANLGATTRIRASLARASGDITVLAEDAEGHSVRVPAGVRDARITVEGNGENVTATLKWDSEHGGSAEGHVATRLARGGAAGWDWPASAPLSGELHAQLPRIGVWSLLAPPGWRLRGSLVANVGIGGTRADPQLTGTLSADDLALRSVVDGLEMQGGRLRMRLEGKRVVIDEFTLHGSGPDGGTLSAKGEGTLTPSGPQATLTAELTKLRASIRSDRQLTVSGNISATRDANGTRVEGKLHIDQASIVLPDQSTPKLSDDVVVRNAAAPITKREAAAQEEAAKKPSEQLQVAIDVDLGDDFHVQGMGVETRLRGTVAITGTSIAQPHIVGVIRAVGGEYHAYGQRLEIERGIIRFTGPVDNPAIDVLAIRPNITQRVGVQVTGTALAPFVRLYSDPDLPDAEKLAWLVTGRAAPATGAESALVQQAALALLASRSGGGKQGIAASLGLDELSFRREGSEGPSVTVGKRLSRKFYAAYERGLSGAMGTLYIFYDVTRRLTVRAQAGERTAVDLIYTLEFDSLGRPRAPRAPSTP